MDYSMKPTQTKLLMLVTSIVSLYFISRVTISKHSTLASISVLTGRQADGFNSFQTYEDNCQWDFLNYTSSPWEKIWLENIENYQNDVCQRLSNLENLNNTIRAFQRIVELQAVGRNQTRDMQTRNDEVLSRMFYRQICRNSRTGTTFVRAEVAQLIEPLIGLLRDPFTVCPRLDPTSVPASVYDGANIQSKRFLLLSVSAPFYVHSLTNEPKNFEKIYMNRSNKNRNILPWMYQRQNLTPIGHSVDISNRKVILIDLGSSYFGAWNGDSAAAAGRWFYEYFERFQVKFDRIIAFEFSPLDPKVAWKDLPDDVVAIYTLINEGVTTSGKFNPWETLRAIAQPSDHVIVKLDIDTPSIERPLMDQLLNDSSIHSLVDELFFEHHITVKEMMSAWGSPSGTLQDSYVLFRKLRELGIRMHSWP